MSRTSKVRSFLAQLVASQARRNVLATGLSAIVGAGVSFLTYSVNLHYLGLKAYGLWLALSVVVTVAQMGNLGMAPAVTKFVAEHWRKGEQDLVLQTVSGAFVITVGATGVVVSTFVLLGGYGIALLGLESADAQFALELLPWVAVLSGYTVVSQLSPAALTGLGRGDLTAGLTAGSRVLAFVVSWALLAGGHGIWALIVGNFSGALALHVASQICARAVSALSLGSVLAVRRATLERLLRFGSGVVGGSLAQMAFLPLNRLLLARYAGVESIPIFEIAWGGSMQIRGLLTTALQALVPDFSAAASTGAQWRVRHLMRQAYRLLFGAGLPIYFVLLVAAPLFLKLWLGEAFQIAILPAFRLMLLGSFLSLLAAPAYFHLVGRGWTRDVFVSHLLQTGVNGLLAIGLAQNATLDPWTLCLTTSVGICWSTGWLFWRDRVANKTPL